MINYGADAGSAFVDAYNVISNSGAASIVQVPYRIGEHLAWPQDSAVWISALSRRMDSVQYIDRLDTDADLLLVKKLLVNGHVLAVGTDSAAWVFKDVASAPGLASPFAGQRAISHLNLVGVSVGHSVTLVGFDESIWIDINGNGLLDAGETGAFKIANSWGTAWGNAGFMWVSYDALKRVSAVVGGPNPAGRRAFVGDNTAYAITAIPLIYGPRMIALATLKSAARSHLRVTLQSYPEYPGTIPPTTFKPGVLQNQGGALAFNGTSNAVETTFAFDASNLIPVEESSTVYSLIVDDTIVGSPATVSSFSLLDMSRGGFLINSPSGVETVDAGSLMKNITYTYSDGNRAPMAKIKVGMVPTKTGAIVTLDGSESYDPDGTIVAWSWIVGDGAAPVSGAIVTRTVEKANLQKQKYIKVTLKVRDNRGAENFNVYLLSF